MQVPTSSMAGLPDKVKKAREIVMARSEGGEFTALDKKLFNVLLGHAYRAVGARTHRVSITEIGGYLMQGRSDKIKESLERLWSKKIAIDYINDDGKPHSIRCHYLSFDLCQVEDGMLEYAFDPILMGFVHDPKIYSLIQLDTVRKFKTPYGLKLYEQMRMFQQRHNPRFALTLSEAHAFFEVSGVYLERFDRFRERVVDAAVAEVNDLAELDVRVQYQTSGRGKKVVGLAFTATPKNAERMMEVGDGQRGRRRRDGQTLDMFQGVSDNERFATPDLRADTMEEARRIAGNDGDVGQMFQTWCEEYGRKGFSANPDAAFLSGVQFKVASSRDAEIEELDVDAIYDTLVSKS